VTAAAPTAASSTGRHRDVPRLRLSGRSLIGLLGLLCVAVTVTAIAAGAFEVGTADVVRILADPFIDSAADVDPIARDVVLQIRLPRVLLGLVVGAGLGTAGALLQGMFGNPLAEPSIIGVSAGSAVGGVFAIALGATAAGIWVLPAAAFAGGLLTTLLVYAGARSGGRTETVTLVLTGIAVNAIAGALIGLAMFISDDAEIRSITFWSLGSVASASWRSLLVAGPLVLIGLLVAGRFARPLDLLGLGEGPAGHLGVDVGRLRLQLITVVAVLTAAGVAVSGIIAFVGLVVPHLVRLLAGPAHRTVLPASALGGAIVLTAGDMLARTIAAPAEIPLGVLTALLGAPVFLVLLRRTRRQQGGWA
jgi:iron complex transport system permease protein